MLKKQNIIVGIFLAVHFLAVIAMSDDAIVPATDAKEYPHMIVSRQHVIILAGLEEADRSSISHGIAKNIKIAPRGILKQKKVSFDKKKLKKITAEEVEWDEQHKDQAENRELRIIAAKKYQKTQAEKRRQQQKMQQEPIRRNRWQGFVNRIRHLFCCSKDVYADE